MQILLIIMVTALYLDEAVPVESIPRPTWNDLTIIAVAVSPFILIAVASWVLQIVFRRRLDRAGQWRNVVASEYAASAARVLVVVVHIASIVFLGTLDLVRRWLGDLVLVDELIILAPPVITIVLIWGFQYDISRRLREAALMGRLDRGQPVYPEMSRVQFVLAQVRLHFVLLLLPIILVIGWREVVDRLEFPSLLPVTPALSDLAEFTSVVAGTGCILLFAPVMVRRLWDTIPLPSGETRDRLIAVCSRHRIRVRELLLWNTFGGMMNGAVMGLIGRVRYILLTDALLDALAPKQVEAVMAHELGHVRRHHLPWLAIVLFASIIVSGFAIGWSLEFIVRAMQPPPAEPTLMERLAMMFDPTYTPSASIRIPMWVEPTAIVMTFALTFLAFGWVSRRFERQADTFAVQHLSGMTRRSGWSIPMTPEAVQTMVSALELVAQLNHISRRKRSWRHGSIAWRVEHLRSLVGQPCGKAPIDRLVMWIKVVSALVLAGGAGLWIVQMYIL